MSRRPVDWSPLAGSDPVPGDPDEVERAARSLADMAEEINRQTANLRKLATADGWDADAGRTFAASAQELSGQLGKAHGRYTTAAGALKGYAPELRHAQSVADAALTEAKQAQATINANRPPDHPPTGPLTPAQISAERQRQQAYDDGVGDLQAAHRKLTDAIDHRDQHAGRAARAIRDVIDRDGLKDSRWDKFKNWISEHADLLRAIARIAELVATILSVIALVVSFIPVLNFLAPVLLGLAALASAVALVCTIMLALAGEASWTDIALALFSVAAVGIAGTGVRLAARAGRAARGGRGAPSPRTGGCFVSGTMVLTVDGLRPIENLLVGDEVVTADPYSGRQVIHRIRAHFRHTVPVVLRLAVQGTQISCSPEHPFWTDASGWKKAVDLSTGDDLIGADGARRPIRTITRREGTFAVYNIEVDGLRTYYVSELQLLVHNKPMRIPRPHGTPKKVSDKYLKDHGIDPHTAKEDLPGPASRFDIYVDKRGNMFGVPKGGKPENGEYLGNIADH